MLQCRLTLISRGFTGTSSIVLLQSLFGFVGIIAQNARKSQLLLSTVHFYKEVLTVELDCSMPTFSCFSRTSSTAKCPQQLIKFAKKFLKVFSVIRSFFCSALTQRFCKTELEIFFTNLWRQLENVHHLGNHYTVGYFFLKAHKNSKFVKILDIYQTSRC